MYVQHGSTAILTGMLSKVTILLCTGLHLLIQVGVQGAILDQVVLSLAPAA